MLKLKTPESDKISIRHYEGVKYYINQVLDFYINFFEIINGAKPIDDAVNILYTNSDLESITITYLAKSLGYGQAKKKKIKNNDNENRENSPG